MAGAIDASLRKFHASLNVSDLQRSIGFYRALLGVEPAKVRADYAKFDLAEPPLVLSLIPGRPSSSGHLNHAGLRVRTAEELVEIQRRLEAAGMPTKREEGVECCYARQTKFWINDPDGALWEIYVFHEDIAEHGKATAPKAQPLAVPVQTAATPRASAWEHRLSEAVPAQIPHADGSLDDIRLEGSINLSPDAPNRSALMREALRALKVGGSIYIHGLAGDGASKPDPGLRGPAASVQYVPAASEVVNELVQAGFADVRIELLSEAAYFVVDGVRMREIRVAATKPSAAAPAVPHVAIYLGPMREVTDDAGNVFRRGELTRIAARDWDVLARSAVRASFLLLKPEQAGIAAGCCTEAAAPVTASV